MKLADFYDVKELVDARGEWVDLKSHLYGPLYLSISTGALTKKFNDPYASRFSRAILDEVSKIIDGIDEQLKALGVDSGE